MTPEMHHALSNPDRIAIMDYLAAIPSRQNISHSASVTEIAVAIKNSPTNTTKHLTKLAKAGLITRKQEKQTVWNTIAPGIVWPIVWRR